MAVPSRLWSSSPRTRLFQLAALTVVVVAMFVLVRAYREHARREAYVHWCNEEGDGGMFTSRQYCEELYDRSKEKR